MDIETKRQYIDWIVEEMEEESIILGLNAEEFADAGKNLAESMSVILNKDISRG